MVTDHLSCLIHEEEVLPLKEDFSDEQLLAMASSTPWYANIVNYLVTKKVPQDLSRAKNFKLMKSVKEICVG